MKKIAYLLPVICLAMVSMAAKADTLKFNTNPSGTEIGPYTLTLATSEGSTSLSLFCMNDTNYIQYGESWGVNVTNGSSFLGSATGSTGFKYEEEAYLSSQYSGSNAADIQDALWTIFDPGTSHKNSHTAGLVMAAAHFNGYTADFLSKTTFYLYDGKGTTPNESTAPQNFVDPVPVPEPSSLILMGSGLLGLAGVVRRKFVRA